jgi:Carbohydrate binding module (family 6)
MKRFTITAVLVLTGSLLSAQSTYTPPVLPPVIPASDVAASMVMMTNINNGVVARDALLQAHDSIMHGPGGYDLQLATINAKLASLPTGSAPPPVVRSADLGYTIQIAATAMLGANVTPNIQKGSASTYGLQVAFGGTSGPAGTFYDYTVNVPADGNYGLSAKVAVTSGSAPIGFHFEFPAGTPVGTVSYQPAGTSYSIVSAPAPASLVAGSQVLRVVIDQPEPGNAVNLLDWIRLVKQ